MAYLDKWLEAGKIILSEVTQPRKETDGLYGKDVDISRTVQDNQRSTE